VLAVTAIASLFLPAGRGRPAETGSIEQFAEPKAREVEHSLA